MLTQPIQPKVAVPPGTEDQARWESTRLRRRMLTSKGWELDLGQHMARHLDPTRMEAWGPPSLGLNMFKSVVNQLSVLYKKAPIVNNPDLSPEAAEWLDKQNVFSQHQRLNKDVVGLRDGLLRIAWNPGHHAADPGISIRRVEPDYVVAQATTLAPTVPIRIEEAVERTDENGETAWYWDVWDISDAQNPYFRIETADKERVDVTRIFAPEMVGNYPYRSLETGAPFLPWVLYHAEDSGSLWGWGEWNELVWGSLDLALLTSFWIHCVKDSSWAQKYGINVRLRGMSTAGEGKTTRSKISTDPASILLFETEAGQSGSLSSFTPSSDPMKIIQSINQYISMLAENIGLNSSDIERTQAESGVAIQLRNDAVRDKQAEYTPHFRKGDEELLAKIGMIANLFSGPAAPPLPTSGYNVVYPAMPLSKEELRELFDLRKEELDLGLISKVDLMMERHPGMTREEAIMRLQEIQRENLLLGGSPITQPNPLR